MRGQTLILVKLAIYIFRQSSAAPHCDMATTARVWEGNLGMSPDFNWIGVLKVHLHDSDKWHVAVTGIVLIKVKYALTNADDVARIPQRVLKTDSQVMFMAAKNKPWYARPLSYVTHPEYDYSTVNTIAVIELNIDDVEDYPLNPICIPTAPFDTSRYLYLVGYTDENELLEKVIYKIQNLEKQVCDEFYDRAGLSVKKHMPVSYVCGYAPYNATHCVWDNGMALVSNATGWFNLIGFGVRGPGCAAPARFINMFPYFSWISSVTNVADEVYDYLEYRRHDDVEFVPIHELFTANSSRRQNTKHPGGLRHEFIKYPFKLGTLSNFDIVPTKDKHTLAIYPFSEMYELTKHSCTSPRVLMYRENFELRTDEDTWGHVTYKLSMFDLNRDKCICVTLTVDGPDREKAILSFRDEINLMSGSIQGERKTPAELFNTFFITERTGTEEKTEPSGTWKPNSNFKPAFLEDDTSSRAVKSYDLFIRFDFTATTVLKFKLFAAPQIPKLVAPRRALNISFAKLKKKLNLGMTTSEKTFNKDEVFAVTDNEVVLDTVSAAAKKTAAVLAVLWCSLISAGLRKAGLIH